MAFKFENLNVWHKSLDLSDEINELAKTFPAYELYNLCHQIRKAADSVNLNIAEGCTGQTNAEFKRFINYSIRSAIEVISCLVFSKKKELHQRRGIQILLRPIRNSCKNTYQIKR